MTRPVTLITILAAFLINATDCVFYAYGDVPAWSDAGVERPSYSSILAWENHLQKAYSPLVRILEYGTTPKGFPLRLLVVKKAGTRAPHPTLIMSGSTHGNEYLHIEDRLPEEILRESKHSGAFSQFLDEGGAFIFIPILNPDGFVAGTRENSHSEDLNRDWTVRPANFEGFHESETKLLASTLDRLRIEESLNYRVSVDYHCCAGALLYPWSFKDAPSISTEVLDQFRALGDMAAKNLGVDFGRTGDVLGYSPKGTTKDYYYDHYGTLALTYEGKYNVEPGRLKNHLAWWEAMVRYLQGEPAPRLKKSMPVATVPAKKRSAD